jgi:hypothetical protein
MAAPSVTSPAEAYFEKLLRTEVGPVKQEVAGIRDIVRAMDQKIDLMIQVRHPGYCWPLDRGGAVSSADVRSSEAMAAHPGKAPA